MWHSDHDHTPEEIKVLRELEYDLFMFDPAFRSMWNNDFNAYFHSLFDEGAWEKKMEETMGHAETDVSRQMLEDPQFAQFMKEQAIMDGILSGDMSLENAPVEMREELKHMLEQKRDMGDDDNFEETEVENQDPLYKQAKNWATNLSKIVGPLYEQFGDIELFRILTNCYIVAGKIVFASEMDPAFPNPSFLWRADRVGYTLALTSLRRCTESLAALKTNRKINKLLTISKFLKTAKEIQRELIDRLDEIEQKRLKS